MIRDQMSERTARRRAAEAKVRSLDLTLFPRWLYAGNLAIPNGGVRRKVELAHIHDPVPDERFVEPLRFGKAT